jgi:hypothetical protein
MHPDIRLFVAQLSAAVIGALVPVVFTAFVSMPAALHGHPGEGRPLAQAAPVHMT